MSELVDAFVTAVKMVFTGDPKVLAITARTLGIACSSTAIAALIFIPVACLIYSSEFKGKRLLVGLTQALYSLPTVFIGTIVFLFLSNKGPLGTFGLLFTPSAIVIGEVLLIAPLVTGLTISALSGVGPEVKDTAVSLGASRFQTFRAILVEARYATVSTLLIAFGRAVSEVGVALIVGGNISNYTRTLTTGMSLFVTQGESARALALGLILISLALIVSLAAHRIQRR
jgi:tungstate transport system permease protein